MAFIKIKAVGALSRHLSLLIILILVLSVGLIGELVAAVLQLVLEQKTRLASVIRHAVTLAPGALVA